MKKILLTLMLTLALGFLAMPSSAMESSEPADSTTPVAKDTAKIAEPSQDLTAEAPVLVCVSEDPLETTTASWTDECFGPYPGLYCQCWQGCCENCKCWNGGRINLCLPDF